MSSSRPGNFVAEVESASAERDPPPSFLGTFRESDVTRTRDGAGSCCGVFHSHESDGLGSPVAGVAGCDAVGFPSWPSAAVVGDLRRAGPGRVSVDEGPRQGRGG